MFLSRSIVLCVTISILASISAIASESNKSIQWRDDYCDAMREAEALNRMAFIYFYAKQPNRFAAEFERTIESFQSSSAKTDQFLFVKLPIDHVVTLRGKTFRLMDHGAFKELKHHQGIAIIDVTDPNSKYFYDVVTSYPFTKGRRLDSKRLSLMLNLPIGSLTQRTLIFAVQTHPENPKSANSEFNAILAKATQKHSQHQASITLQGHHNWNTRFHQINRQLKNGASTQEVCAESWPGQGLVDAAEECVHSWRQSPGHWGAVRSRNRFFGYDMKRGSNGVWYATGIFARVFK